MTKNYHELALTPLVKILGKNPEDFQRKDLMKVIEEHNIRQINLHYVGIDGKLKELKVPVNSYGYAELILAQGERIDGSNIFKGIIDTSNSDLYIVPCYKTAFISPFEENTMGVLCRFMDKNGKPAMCAPQNILIEAHRRFKEQTGLTLNVLGELEFYIIYDQKDHLFTGMSQRGYHQSSPFVKSRQMLNEMMDIISTMTASIKYGHSEVGYINELNSTDPEVAGRRCEQYEIEFLPRPIEDMSNYLPLAKWVIRNVAHKWGCTATFTPKLEEGMAGNGLHFHLELLKNGKNTMVGKDGKLSDDSKKLIAGLCKYAPSITAFGNSVSSAYLRLVAHQEAPTKVCWSEQNRAALIRIPLGWTLDTDMAKIVNPNQKDIYETNSGTRQTVELRSPDGSAHIHLLLAAITIAALDGLTKEDSLSRAEKLHLSGNSSMHDFESLPSSCFESAEALQRDRHLYVKDGLVPDTLIDFVVEKLKLENDKNINERFSHLTAEMRLKATREIMHKDLHKQ
ncbi:MAG: glutamine synthetase [Bacteriovoracaceae bacterium]|nr:glutamine synthetase [Bacteriovoracaceae bacterium]